MSNVLVGVNSKCGVQSKRRCESHESCVCIVGFSACGCQKKSVEYETECRHVAVQRINRIRTIYSTETDTSDIILTLYIMQSYDRFKSGSYPLHKRNKEHSESFLFFVHFFLFPLLVPVGMLMGDWCWQDVYETFTTGPPWLTKVYVMSFDDTDLFTQGFSQALH